MFEALILSYKFAKGPDQDPKGDELYLLRLNLGEISVEDRIGVDVQITRSKIV